MVDTTWNDVEVASKEVVMQAAGQFFVDKKHLRVLTGKGQVPLREIDLNGSA